MGDIRSDLHRTAEELAYLAIGAALLVFQRAQLERTEITKRIGPLGSEKLASLCDLLRRSPSTVRE